MLKRYSPFVVVDVPSMGEVGNAVVVSPAALDIVTDKPIHQHDQDYDERLQVRGVGEPLTYPSPITVKVEMREDDGGDYIQDKGFDQSFKSRQLLAEAEITNLREILGCLPEHDLCGKAADIRRESDLWRRGTVRLNDAIPMRPTLSAGIRKLVESYTGEEPTDETHAVSLMASAIERARAGTEVYERRAKEAESKLSLGLAQELAQEKEIDRLTQALKQREREFHAMLLGYRMLARLMGEGG